MTKLLPYHTYVLHIISYHAAERLNGASAGPLQPHLGKTVQQEGCVCSVRVTMEKTELLLRRITVDRNAQSCGDDQGQPTRDLERIADPSGQCCSPKLVGTTPNLPTNNAPYVLTPLECSF